MVIAFGKRLTQLFHLDCSRLQLQDETRDLIEHGNFDIALETAHAVEGAVADHFGKEHPVYASAMNNLGLIYKVCHDAIQRRVALHPHSPPPPALFIADARQASRRLHCLPWCPEGLHYSVWRGTLVHCRDNAQPGPLAQAARGAGARQPQQSEHHIPDQRLPQHAGLTHGPPPTPTPPSMVAQTTLVHEAIQYLSDALRVREAELGAADMVWCSL